MGFVRPLVGGRHAETAAEVEAASAIPQLVVIVVSGTVGTLHGRVGRMPPPMPTSPNLPE